MGGLPSSIIGLMEDATPKINPIIANGLAVEHLKHIEEYIDSVFRSAVVFFPEGFVYNGCRRCTPDEEWAHTANKKGAAAVFDVAKSDVYMMEYMFSYKGDKVPSRYIYLPYVTKGGIFYLGGSKFIISPVLADKVISIGMTDVFVRLLKARLTFYRSPYYYIANDKRENVQVAWAKIYNKKTVVGVSSAAAVKGDHTLVHYLLCKYGFTETFKTFAGVIPIIGGDEIDESKYPPNEWVIIKSTQLKPKKLRRAIYEPTNVRLAIPIDNYTPAVKNFVAGFYYVLDHFPERVNIQYVDDVRMWQILLGLMIWNDNVSEGKIHSDIMDHFASLDEYVDVLVTDKFKEIGYNITNVYQIFSLIINKFDEWSLTSNDSVNTMYDKELSILYYVCYDIIEAIFKLYFKLKSAAKRDLDVKKINDLMSEFLKPGLIYRLNHDHGEITTTSSSGDNMFFKITSLLVPQSKTSKRGSAKSRAAIKDPAKWFHASIAEVGAVAAIPKSEPTGRSRVSPFLQISHTGLVLRNEENRKLLDNVQRMVKRNI